MTMTTPLFRLLPAFILACALAMIGWQSSAHAQIAVMVNGEPITNYDIDQRSKLVFLSTKKLPDRQQVIDELIDEKVKIREGKKFGVDPSATDVDQSYTSMSSRMRITGEQLTKSLETRAFDPTR